MKKIIAVALLLLFVGTGAFALDKAVGGGALFNSAWTLGVDEYRYAARVWSNYYGEYMYDDWILAKDEYTISRNGFGAFAFFGIGRYFELNLGFLYKNPNKLKLKWEDKSGYDGEVYTSGEGEMDISWLDGTAALQFGLYFKYPFVISDRVVIFPTAGIDYEYSFDTDWWDDLWFRAGVGLDVFFTDRLFLRTHFIYGAALPISDDWDFLTFSHGLLIKAGIGWMF